MSEDHTEHDHHSLRERLDAAEAAAEEVVSEESGEVNKLAVPFEELAAAVHAAIHPDELADRDGPGEADGVDDPAPPDDAAPERPASR
ncbi:MAG TPA: hypothetical protein VH661_00480 [Candidatus Dormibacteraeota bacterium]|jgi:hypothetical protein|nr:hypothetical protein [Candidatus Dormibacteraeota bacterium]